MTLSTSPAIDGGVDDATYTQLTRLYNAQSQAFDSGDAEAWAATFTEQATFRTEGMGGPPAQGREQLAQGLRYAAAAAERENVTTRHWMSTLVVHAIGDDTVQATSYALIVEIGAGAVPGIKRSTVCHDVLVRGPHGWRVDSRVVSLDGAGEPDGT